jgi:hypothetical protein
VRSSNIRRHMANDKRLELESSQVDEFGGSHDPSGGHKKGRVLLYVCQSMRIEPEIRCRLKATNAR